MDKGNVFGDGAGVAWVSRRVPVGNSQGLTPALLQMAAFMKEDAQRWRAVIRSANVTLDRRRDRRA